MPFVLTYWLAVCRSKLTLTSVLPCTQKWPFEMPPKRKAASSRAANSKAADSTSSLSNSSKRRKTEPAKETCEDSAVESNVELKPSVCNDSAVKQSPKGGTFNLKIISWNVNGVRAVLGKGKAFDYFGAEPCDILCLQETKCSDKDLPAELKQWNQFPHKYYSSSQRAGYAGVCVLSKIKPLSVQYGLGVEEHDQEGRVITAHFDNFILVNTYTPNAGRGLIRLKYRMQWDEDFRNYLRKLDSQKPVILCGDLNVSHKEIDLANPKSNVKNAGFTPEERASFTKLLEAGFVDSFRILYPDRQDAYTYWSYMHAARSKNIGWRLDYFVLSTRLSTESLCDQQIRSAIMGSDHCPIVLYMSL